MKAFVEGLLKVEWRPNKKIASEQNLHYEDTLQAATAQFALWY